MPAEKCLALKKLGCLSLAGTTAENLNAKTQTTKFLSAKLKKHFVQVVLNLESKDLRAYRMDG